MVATWDITLWLDDVETFDYGDHGLARLLWQYRGSQPRMQAFLDALLDSFQSLENVAFEVLANRWPLTAEGDQLDVVGKIVGQARGERTDDQYRLYIIAKILINKSKGRLANITEILDLMGYPTIEVIEHYPAELLVSVAGADYGEDIGPFVKLASPAGVAFRWTFSDEDAGDTFQFANTLGADDTDSSSGFGDLGEATQTTGGYFGGGMTL